MAQPRAAGKRERKPSSTKENSTLKDHAKENKNREDCRIARSCKTGEKEKMTQSNREDSTICVIAKIAKIGTKWEERESKKNEKEIVFQDKWIDSAHEKQYQPPRASQDIHDDRAPLRNKSHLVQRLALLLSLPPRGQRRGS